MIDELPDDPTQLTAEMLTFLFRDGGLAPSNPGVEVAEVTTEPLAQGSAFLGSLARLNITWADRDTALPNRFVAKVPTQDPGGRTVGKMLNVWVREAEFYARLAPLVATPVPTCRANFISGDKALLLLDDLYPAAAGDQLIGASADQAHAAVEALAQLHAPFWGRPRTPAVAWVPGLDTPGTSEALGSAMAASLPRFDERFGDLLPELGLEWLRAFVPLLGQWRADLLSKPLTIAHADYRLENMLFGPQGEITVIDWQTAMFTGGATDLSFFLATNLEVDLRRSLEPELVSNYIDTLIGHGVEASATAHVREDYEYAHLWWMGMLANNLSNIETPDERSRSLFEAMLTRLYTAALDVDSGRFCQ